MSTRATIMLAALLALLTLAVALCARRLEVTETRLVSAEALLATTRSAAERVVELRSRQQRVAEHRRPEQDVIARVNACLAEAGIPAERFGGVRPDSDAALAASGSGPRPGYRRQSVQIALRRLTVGQLGGFLGAWRRTQPLWTPTRIELLHARDRDDAALYDASILVAATYLAEP